MTITAVAAASLRSTGERRTGHPGTVRRVAARCFAGAGAGDHRCMEHRRSRLEDLPPLALRELRDLVLDAPPDEGRDPHVASASGVVRRGDFVYVIGDDLLSLAIFRLSLAEPGRVRRVLPASCPPPTAPARRPNRTSRC